MCDAMHPVLCASQTATVFHPGEQLVQEKVGVRQQVLRSGLEDFVRGHMPEQHRLFYEQQPFLYLGSRDATGRPWATVLAGRPGFLSAPNAQHLYIKSVKLSRKDPLADSLKPGVPVGMLGMEMHTRRRNRLNGIISPATPGSEVGVTTSASSGAPPHVTTDKGLAIDISLSFGNCPKYIQGRQFNIDYDVLERPGFAESQDATSGGAVLGPEQRRIVRQADTFFIATCYDGPAPISIKGSAIGCDMSHRGGPTGFIKLTQGFSGKVGGSSQEYTVLRWPDYKGNNMFQTFGNLMLNPKAGLLIIDFETGDTLHMTGEATVDFEDMSLPGALRTVSFRVHSFVHVHKALPIKQVGATDYSPFLPSQDIEDASDDMGDGIKVAATAASTAPRAPRTQTLECVSVVQETHDVSTFEFKLPQASDPAAAYKPGQYATFEFPAAAVDPAQPSSAPPVVRTWTVSSHPSWAAKSGTFTISVKRAGAVSSLLHRTMKPGATVTFSMFGGDFVPGLLPSAAAGGGGGSGSVLLVAAGIGITPMRAMLHDFVLYAPAASSAIERLLLFYTIRGVEDAAFVDELAAAALTANQAAKDSNRAFTVQLVLSISQGDRAALAGAAKRWPEVAVHGGRLSKELLLQYGRGSAAGSTGGLEAVRGVFMCGPPGFMAATEVQLKEAGLDVSRLFSESFSF